MKTKTMIETRRQSSELGHSMLDFSCKGFIRIDHFNHKIHGWTLEHLHIIQDYKLDFYQSVLEYWYLLVFSNKNISSCDFDLVFYFKILKIIDTDLYQNRHVNP